MDSGNLSNTSYAVLGLLSFGKEHSGYELRKSAENLRFFYWSPAQSQIYSELRRLARQGLVASSEVIQQGKPDKRLYSITQKGKDEFRHWLQDSTLEPTVVKHSLALRLFFGHMAEPKQLELLLESFIKDTQKHLAELSIVQEPSAKGDTLSYPALIAEWGYSYYRNELEVAQKMLERLKVSNSEETL
jgi:DNA-binding PadR family transcriptional regulator